MSDHSTAAGRPSGGRKALSPGLRTFLVIDVILVVTFLVLAAMWLGNRQDPSPEAAGTPVQSEPESEPEQSAPDEPTEAEEITEFQLPSGNIYCSMTETTAQCTIVTFGYTPPDPPEGCAGTIGNVLSVSAGEEGTMPCVTAPPGPPAEGMPVLEYGDASTVGEMTCQSSPKGVYCQHDPSRNGFSVARAGYRFF